MNGTLVYGKRSQRPAYGGLCNPDEIFDDPTDQDYCENNNKPTKNSSRKRKQKCNQPYDEVILNGERYLDSYDKIALNIESVLTSLGKSKEENPELFLTKSGVANRVAKIGQKYLV